MEPVTYNIADPMHIDCLIPSGNPQTASEDRKRVAETLSLEGEQSLLKGDLNDGMSLFSSAIELDPDNAKIFFHQGLALYTYGLEAGKEKSLLLANKKFKKACLLLPDYFASWHMWGNALLHLGKTSKEYHYIQEAKEKLEKAISYSTGQPKEMISTLYWNYGKVASAIATHSTEALDWQIALDFFQKATSYRETLPAEFWQDFGEGHLQVSTCINDVRHCIKAIHCFKHALSSHPNTPSTGWESLSVALQSLYDYTHDEDHFSQANDCFATALRLRSDDAGLWLKWASLLCQAGRKMSDSKKVRASIEKCHRAHSLNPSDPHILATWGEALALLGELTERIDLLCEGQNKLSLAVEMDSELPTIWYSFGLCLNSFGRYFNDYDYHYQAIEHFQQGLSIDRRLHTHWQAIAATYSALGQLETDIDPYEKAIRFFCKAIDLQPNNSYYLFEYALCLLKIGEVTRNEKWFEHALAYFERALNIQKNAAYIHPDWLFHYARTLDLLGDYREEESYYTKAIEVFSHVLMIDPDFFQIHHHLALSFSHLGDLTGDIDNFYRALHYFRIASKQEEENDLLLVDQGITLINAAEHCSDRLEAENHYRDAELKLTQAAKLGNATAYYHLGCLYSLLRQYEKAMGFIEKADSFHALPPLEEILQDDWLDNLRSTAYFKDFLERLEKRTPLQEER